MKTCSNCGETKESKFFYKKLDKLSAHCKICTNKKNKEYYQKNKEKICTRQIKYYNNNKEKRKEYMKKWSKENWEKYYQKNKEKILQQKREKYKEDIENNRKMAIEKYHKDIEKSREKARKRYHKNVEKNRAYARHLYHKADDQSREHRNKRQREWLRKKIKEDPFYKRKRNVRTMITKSFIRKGWAKNTKTQEILGCDYDTAIKHLESTFIKNYGIPLEEAAEEVHIDHITPLAMANTDEELVKLNHYTNLQYLYASDNLQKSDSLDWKMEE